MQAFLSEFRWCQPDSAIIKFSSSVFFPVILLSISDLCPRSIILSSWKMEIWGFFFHFFIKNFPWSTVWLPRICVLSCFSRVRLCATTWTITRKIPLSMGLSRQEYWTGWPCPPPGDLPDPGIKSASLCLPHCRWILCPVSCQESPRGRMDTCICTVEPLCCAPETITLLTGYAPSQ